MDAIVGASKFLHTVLEEECIGCKLCVAPCPMDCIDIVESQVQANSEEKRIRANRAKVRYQARTQRLLKQEAPKLQYDPRNPSYKAKIRKEIAEAIERVKRKVVQ